MDTRQEIHVSIEAKIFQCLDLIRGSLEITEYHLITFLLWLKYEKIVEVFSNDKEHVKHALMIQIVEYEGTHKSLVEDLLTHFESAIELLSDERLLGISQILDSIEGKVLNENFVPLAENLFYQIAKVEGRFGGEYLLPMELSRLACNLFDTDLKIIYNPFAGLASFGVFVKESSLYIGEEINPKTKSLGELRLLIHGKTEGAYLFKTDSINNWNEHKTDSKYDIIISNPPFGVRLPKEIGYNSIHSIEQFVIQKGLEDIRPDGKIVALVPQGFLFRGGFEQDLREKLIANDLLELVISFPPGLLSNTGIPVSLIVINKNKTDNGLIRFVNSAPFVKSISSREKRLDDKALLSVIWDQGDTEYRRLVSNEIVKSFDSNLNANRYFVETINGVKLNDIVSAVRGVKLTTLKMGRFVRIRDLRNDKLDFKLNAKEIEVIELPRNSMEISESVLLLAMRWSTIKPTYFEYVGEPIYISQDILAVRVDTYKADVAFLINEFNSGYVHQQLNAIRLGATVPSFRRQDLLDIEIKLPSLDEQIQNVKRVREEIMLEMKKQIENFQEVHGLQSDVLEQNSFIRHSIAGALKNMRGMLKNIKTIVETQVRVIVPEVYTFKANPKSDLNFGDHLEILDRDLMKVSDITRRTGLETDLIQQAMLEPIEIISFLEQYVGEIKMREHVLFYIEFDFDKEAFLDEEGNRTPTYINGNAELLSTLLNNLIDNAEKHAFNQTKSSKNKIEFYLMLHSEDSKIELLVSNTGRPFPSGFTLDMFRQKGSRVGDSAGDGLGGWYINEVIKKHNGSLDIIDETGPEGLPDSDLATSFEITFPLITID
jgi:type I restriction enzyme M protein